MRKTGKLRGERIAAWVAVFIMHALLGWALLRLPVPMPEGRTKDSVLDVVWVMRPRELPKPPEHAGVVASVRSKALARSTSLQVPPASPASPEGHVATAQPLSAIFIQQAVEAEARRPPGSFQSDPFANRSARLPGRAANTFRMRPPPSLAERVAMVGKLFGGADDPCRSARDSINELSQAGDSRELQYALDYERRFCR